MSNLTGAAVSTIELPAGVAALAARQGERTVIAMSPFLKSHPQIVRALAIMEDDLAVKTASVVSWAQLMA